MKKLYISLLLTFTSFTSLTAQVKKDPSKWEFTTTAHFILPAGGLSQTHHFGIGASGKAEYFVFKKASLFLEASYNYFPGASYAYRIIEPPFNQKITKRGIPFTLIPLLSGFNYYFSNRLYISCGAGLALGGSMGNTQAKFGFQPAIGFLFPLKKATLNIGINYLSTSLKVKDAHSRQGGVLRGPDMARALLLSAGLTF